MSTVLCSYSEIEVMTEAVSGDPYLINNSLSAERRENLLARFSDHDIGSIELSHLRSHQINMVEAFKSVASEILCDARPNAGMAGIHPTGSGKTITAAAIAQAAGGLSSTGVPPERTLMLVPNTQLLDQTAGYNGELGKMEEFAPDVSVAEYSGRTKDTGARATIMSYQSLGGAIRRGHIADIDPGLIICDEGHHLIDGRWNDEVRSIAKGRLLLGLTATPAYSRKRDMFATFPYILDQKTMHQGIEQGILAPIRSFVYQGKSRIQLQEDARTFDEESVFEAIANSEDNYTAIKICAEEAALGRSTVFSCVAGHDRAHAKVLAEMLNATFIDTPNGRRRLRARYVGGELPINVIRDTLQALRRKEIDAVTNVNLLLEGWDSPETETLIIMRPTDSRVLAEQRIGRVLRPMEGKVAHVHEFIYGVEGADVRQVTAQDVLREQRTEKGIWFRRAPLRDTTKELTFFTSPNVDDEADHAQRVANATTLPATELYVSQKVESIPLDWRNSYQLAHMFNSTPVAIDTLLGEYGATPHVDETSSITRRFYSPKYTELLAKSFNIPVADGDTLTYVELLQYCRVTLEAKRMTRKQLDRSLEAHDLQPSYYYFSDRYALLMAFPPHAKQAVREMAARLSQQARENNGATRHLDPAAAHSWLNDVLVSPSEVGDPSTARQLASRQLRLVQSVRLIKDRLGITVVSQAIIEQYNLTPTSQMHNVMKAKDLTFGELLTAAAISGGSEAPSNPTFKNTRRA